MKIHSLSKARQSKNSKIAVDNIATILRVLKLTISALDHFRAYKSVQAIIATIKYEKVILESQLKKISELNKDKK